MARAWRIRAAARTLVGTLLLALGGTAGASDFEAGMQAANRRDFAAAARAWRPLAERGEARAQYHLGLLYEEGRGVARDPATAAAWYRRAAEQGQAQAQNALGILYVQGLGVARAPVEAYAWFARAARGGDGFARRNLERLSGMLSPEEIAEGERRARAPGAEGE